MMKNIAPKTLLIIFFTISLAACQQRKNFSYDYGHASNNKDPYSYASNDNHPEDQQYYEYEGVSSPDYISGICPEDWIIEREDENTVRLKDTDLEIVLSTGFVPDDYFMPNGFVNDEKYAEHYA
ncbi:MAG: hypothetical protein GWN62_36120, partial [Aliifodinibius sp.]|nr:hypothetical protein [Fodinibius sp.]